jgi:hypothetical protein
LNLQKIDNAIFGTATPRDDQRHNDWMVVGLAYALPSVEPLRVDPGAYLAEGREVIGISAFQRGVHWVSRDEPIAQVCKLWRLRFMEGAPPIMTTNCQGAPGASGSTVIAESGGDLVAAGIRVKVFEGRGTLGYSPVMGDAVAINSSIIAALEKLSGKKVLEGSVSHAPLFIPRRGKSVIPSSHHLLERTRLSPPQNPVPPWNAGELCRFDIGCANDQVVPQRHLRSGLDRASSRVALHAGGRDIKGGALG